MDDYKCADCEEYDYKSDSCIYYDVVEASDPPCENFILIFEDRDVEVDEEDG